MAEENTNNGIRINADEIDSIEYTHSADDEDVERIVAAPSRAVEFGFSGELSSREGIEMESDLPGFVDGEYQLCQYCDGDSFVHVDHFEDHLQEEHNIIP